MQSLQRSTGYSLNGCRSRHARSTPSSGRLRSSRRTIAGAAGPVTTVAQQQDDSAPSTSASSSAQAVADLHSPLKGRVAQFRATKQVKHVVRELEAKSLAEYMALPASQYSVLDARKIERVDDSTFRCYVGQLRFLGFSVEPVITVSVTVTPRGCIIRLLSCCLQGSKFVEDVNDRFAARMTNEVTWAPTEDPGQKEIASQTTIEVDVEVPGWLLLPASAVSATGSGVMAATLNAMVPRFLAQLEKDYALWASGDESRRPLGEGVI